MNPNQRLYVTPEERARRMAEQNKHPHGGEGNCGGREGHGTPELQQKKAERGTASDGEARNGSGGRRGAKPSDAPVSSAAKGSVNDSVPSGNGISREQLNSAIKLSFALGEPACRRYGLRSLYQRKWF